MNMDLKSFGLICYLYDPHLTITTPWDLIYTKKDGLRLG